MSKVGIATSGGPATSPTGRRRRTSSANSGLAASESPRESRRPSERARTGARSRAKVDPDVASLLSRSLYRGDQVSFDDIVGHEGAKRELAVVAEGFRRQATALSLGLTLVKGVIIMGPPGTGKTMLAKALASSVGRPAYILPSAEMTPASLRKVYEALFGEACVVVWDEIQCLIAGYGEARTIAAFCAALDGVQPSSGPITIGLTAEPEHRLDQGALRSGRLTTKVTIIEPDEGERRELWAAAIDRVPVVGEIDLDGIADFSEGFTGADIAATVSVALGLAMVEGIDALTPAILDEAVGRRNHVIEVPDKPEPPADQWVEAVHEAGHALYVALTWGPDCVKEVRLLLDGRPSPGTIPEPPATLRPTSRACLRQQVEITFAGTVAEELVFGPDGVTTGSHDDIYQATGFIRSLVEHAHTTDGFPPVSIDALEHGGDSDRGSVNMRNQLFDAISREASLALAEVRSRLTGWGPVISDVARVIHDEPTRRMIQPELGELLRETVALGTQPMPAMPAGAREAEPEAAL
jgi:cell division protease FtsH